MSSVQVILEVVNQARKEVQKMGQEMRQHLETDLESTLDIEDHGRIERTKNRMRQMSRDRDATLKPKISNYDKKKAEAQIKDLKNQANDTYGNLPESKGGSGTMRHPDTGKFASSNQIYGQEAGIEATGKNGGSTMYKSVKRGVQAATRGQMEIGRIGSDNRAEEKIRKKELAEKAKQRNEFRELKKELSKRKGVVTGKTGRQVVGSSGRHGSTFQSPKSSGFQSTNRDDEDSNLQLGNQVGGTNKASALDKKLRDMKKKSRDFKENFDITEHHMGKMSKNAKKFGQNFKRFSPNIMMWWKLVAMLLPMMIALRVQAMGVMAALQGIAAGGAGLVVGGLFGHGEGIEDSMAMAERRMNELKREMFQIFRPVLQEFAPISERFLNQLPQMIRPLTDTISQLTVFEGPFMRLMKDIVGHVDEVLNHLIQYVDEFEQVGRRFLDFGVQRLMRFMDFLFETMVSEQDAMMQMVDTFTAVVNVVWQVLKVVSHLGAVFSWVFEIFSAVATFLSNKLIATILYWGTSLYFLINITNSLIAHKKMLLGILLKIKAIGFAGFIAGLVGKVMFLTGAVWGLAQAFAQLALKAQLAWGAVTLGVGAAVASLGSHLMANQPLNTELDNYGGGAGGNPGGNTNVVNHNTFNVDGEMSKQQKYELEDIARNVHSEEDEIENERST